MGSTFKQMGWGDKTVNVQRPNLLQVLRKNRDAHIADYNQACAGYRTVALAWIDEAIARLQKQKEEFNEEKRFTVYGVSCALTQPVSYEKAYDQIIRMMEMSVDEVIELTASQFACFVMDDWDWKESWTAVNAAYMR